MMHHLVSFIFLIGFGTTSSADQIPRCYFVVPLLHPCGQAEKAAVEEALCCRARGRTSPLCHQGCLSSANHQPEVRNNLRAVSAEPFSQVPSRKTLDCLPRLTRSQTRSNARGIRASSLTSLSPLPSGAQRQRRCADDLGSTIDFPSSGPPEGLQPQKSSCLCFYCSKSDRPMLGAAASRWLCERLCSVARRLSFSGAVTILKHVSSPEKSVKRTSS